MCIRDRSESITFSFLSEIIQDADLPEKEFMHFNRIIVEKDQDFLFQLGVKNERQRIMQSPMPQKYVYIKDAISFYEKKIATLKRIQNDKVFKSQLKFNLSQVGIILQNYLTDLVVIETQIEEFDICRRSDLINNSEIQRLNKEFADKFLVFINQLQTN